ncbi:MAG: methyltransferase domain-containing protein [Ruminococcus sp.]|nr:methyltransferase domain-containing protein [Ruminococcus sp.]
MGIYICPVCGKELEAWERTFVCGSGHSFDTAKSGYVNLLLSKHIGKAVHGDNKLMVQARRDFLESGYYSGLKDALCRMAAKHFSGSFVLDAGCGEGYYTGAIADEFEQLEIAADIYGIDISKIAVDMAAKRHKNVRFAAASVFHIPVLDSSCDMLTTVFSPYCGGEFQRVLRDGGTMLMVIPGEEHLWEMKQAIYDIPYKNQVKDFSLEGFELMENQHIRYSIELESKEHIKALFSMTPYYYRTGREQQERLYSLERLMTTVEFRLLVYRKK